MTSSDTSLKPDSSKYDMMYYNVNTKLEENVNYKLSDIPNVIYYIINVTTMVCMHLTTKDLHYN